MLPKKPKREDFIKSGTDTEWISYWTEWTIYERARAERAIEALKEVARGIHTPDIIACKALREIQASEES